jgi:hypothetical protein
MKLIKDAMVMKVRSTRLTCFKGDAGELDQKLRHRLRPVGWRGAHRGSLATLRKTVAERWSSVERMRSCQSWTSGWVVAVGNGETCGAIGWAGGGWSVNVIDELLEEQATVE